MKCYLLLLSTITTSAIVTAAEPGRLILEVTEPIGVHRDGAPVHVELALPKPVPISTAFRLTFGGKPITAQFRPNGDEEKTANWWLDFVSPSSPFEKRQYVVDYGKEVKPGPERKRGHRLIRREDAFVVSNAPYIDWTIPHDFSGFLRSVDFEPFEHLKPDSMGLSVRDRDGRLHQLGGEGTTARVVRAGPMTVALRFENTETSEALRGVDWSADLIFPGPVSWVELHLKIDDPQNQVVEATLQLKLNLDEPDRAKRTLVELGAARTIYRSLIGEGEIELRADANAIPAWQVFRGTNQQLQPFVVGSKDASLAEGWAHVMDRKRCLAIAFDNFGRKGEERIKIRANGVLTASKRFADPAQKQWRSWLHFVQFPPQQSATSDPRMMQNPLTVRQLKDE